MGRFRKKRSRDFREYVEEKQFTPEPLRPLNDKQRSYIRGLLSYNQCFCLGPAGTGKTFIAASLAADELFSGKIGKIIICRPTIGADEEIGFLPGGINSKMAPWTAPFFDCIEERYGKVQVQRWLSRGALEIVPLAYMRGRTFKNAWVLLDEAQNISVAQMKMFLTRIGDGSKVVVSGDLEQSDLKGSSGLKVALDIIKKQKLKVPIVEFTKADIVRSGVCAMWSEAFEKHEAE